MLSLNLRRLLSSRGIDDPNAYLRSIGMASYTASRLLTNNVRSISYDRLELLCLRLNCTVNDLFDWEPPTGMQDATRQPLAALKRETPGTPISTVIRSLPPDKLEQLRNYIDRLEQQE